MQIEIGRRKKTILSERNISFHELVYTKKGAAHDINLSDPDSGVLVGPTVELQPQKIVKVTLITIHVCIGPFFVFSKVHVVRAIRGTSFCRKIDIPYYLYIK